MQSGHWDLPPPPDIGPIKDSSARLVIVIAITAAVLLAAFFVPIPLFFMYVPGPVRDVGELVEVDDVKTYSSEGQLFLTTVSIETKVTLWDVVRAAVDPAKDVVLEEEVTQGQSLKDVQEQAKADMRESKQAARQTAFGALGLPAGNGARVLDTIEDAPAGDVFEEGDRVVAVDGEGTSTACDVGTAIAAHDPGDAVRMTYVRDGRRRTVTLTAAEHPQVPDAAFVGIEMADVPGETASVDFKTGRIAGPSAGLMFTLALYDRLTPDDLTGGRKIAGTGTIQCGGGVGPIGGVEEKVAAAEDEGAEIFLAPDLNYEAARGVADEIEVVSVSSFDEAVEYLEGL
jgi:PDZ domain-containing protein